MNAVLYKVYIEDRHESQLSQFETTDVMCEAGLIGFYHGQIEAGRIAPDNLQSKGLDKSMTPDTDIIMAILNDNDQYDVLNGYMVERITVELSNKDLC